MKTALQTALLLAFVLAGLPRTEAAVVLDAKVAILVGSEEPQPVQLAAQDLAGDCEKVLGRKPVIVHDVRDAAPVTILIGFRSALVHDLRPAALPAPESFSISVSPVHWSGSPASEAVLLTGADMRGTIFAIYQFSQDYLGVDPVYYWTDHQPARRSQIELDAHLKRVFPPPRFAYRGFFLNDEDLLTGWAPAPRNERTGISLEAWNKIYETILRLKGNMVAPGTWIFPDDAQIQLAARRGLIITQHHAIPLGMNVARWPKDVPYSYSAHPEILERAWRNAVNEYAPDVEVLWTVGLRGLSDVSYAAFDPSVRGNNEALGHLISKAIADQMQIVRAKHPDARFITSLWQEGARLVQQGYLSIPREVGTVWADDGYGYLQDNGEVQAGQGAYYHVAMMNGRANQLTEMVPVERICSELGRYLRAGATHYMLLNTSDIRPVVMTTKAVMDLAWGGFGPGGVESADDFYRRWSEFEFGKHAAPQIAAVYKEYFEAPAHGSFGPNTREYGDQYYHTQARLLLLASLIQDPLYSLPSQSPSWIAPRILDFPPDPAGAAGRQRVYEMAGQELQRCREAQPRWDALWSKAVAAEAAVLAERRPFYEAGVLTMIAINRESNRMLELTAQAVQQAISGDRAGARASAERAREAIGEIHRAEAAAEYGKWKNWYRGDWLTGVNRTDELLASFCKIMQDPLGPLPPPVIWSGWEAYHHIMQYEGDRTVDVN
jgi:hypothetical protein